MKSRITAVLILLFTCCWYTSFSQHIQQPNCIKFSYQSQVDSLKRVFSTQGFSLFKETAMVMESSYEMPVLLQLVEGSEYHFIFIGERNAQSCQMSLFNAKGSLVFNKKSQLHAADGNIIDYSYAPIISQHHVFMPLQVNSTNSNRLLGYVLMFKKDS